MRLLGVLGVLILSLYFLSKIRPQKTNSYDLDPDNNLAKYQIQRDRNQQNHL
ncbi:hypothetical protein [Clostridium sp.]|uniref:hypothetical protein n=1 Tax=Clostridium sp. TaxID=1506 RepID=UPI0032171A54